MNYSLSDIEFNPFKHLVHFDRIQALARGEETFPVTLELDVSSCCNHHCRWCVDPAGSHTNRLMPAESAERVLHEAEKLNVKGVVFKGGGESTLHPQLDRIMAAAAGIGFETGLVTNGSGLDNPDLRDVLVSAASYVRVSIDGPDRKSHEAIHGSRDFDAVISGIRTLVEARGERRHPVIGATFCLDYTYRHLISECVRLGSELNLDYILIRPPFTEEVGYASPDTAGQLKKLRNDILEIARNNTTTLTIFAGNWIGDREMATTTEAVNTETTPGRRDLSVQNLRYNGIEHRTGRCIASALSLIVTSEMEVYGCCCLRNIKNYSFGQIDYEKGITLQHLMTGRQRQQALEQMKAVKCLAHCTHPLNRINELIEYMSLPRKYHASFV